MSNKCDRLPNHIDASINYSLIKIEGILFSFLLFSFHPSLPLLATTSGQRQFAMPGDESDDSGENAMDQDIMVQVDNSLRIWAAGEQR